MTILYAFLLGGVVAAIAQAVFVLAKMDNPIKCLILFFCVGGVLGAFGVISVLEETCQAGIMAMVLDPGAGIQVGVMQAMAGNPLPLVILLVTIISMIVLGIISGLIACSKMPRK